LLNTPLNAQGKVIFSDNQWLNKNLPEPPPIGLILSLPTGIYGGHFDHCAVPPPFLTHLPASPCLGQGGRESTAEQKAYEKQTGRWAGSQSWTSFGGDHSCWNTTTNEDSCERVWMNVTVT
jgi:hypothetical protein